MTIYDNYIFDLDGTLLDTLNDLAASTNHALRQHGMPEHTTDEVRRMVGNGVAKLIERAVPQGLDNPDYEQVLADFKTHYSVHSMDTTRPYPGIEELLHTLKQQGKRLAVVSNKLQAGVTALRNTYFAEWMEVAIGEREGIARKPDPAMLYAAMEELGAEKTSTYYVGDSDVDILTAHRAGVPCISVLWGFRDRPFLERHGATCLVEAPADILALLDAGEGKR